MSGSEQNQQSKDQAKEAGKGRQQPSEGDKDFGDSESSERPTGFGKDSEGARKAAERDRGRSKS